MTTLALLTAMLVAHSATSLPGPDIELTEQKAASYEALAGGDAERAKADLEARLLQEPEDPALLINLAAAYARLGRPDQAAMTYQAAADSKSRYRLELADGRWMDSRRVARKGLDSLGLATRLARR